MPFNGDINMRDNLMKLQQQLSDHEATQRIDMGEIKATTLRIESKLDAKVGKDEVDKVSQAIEHKADKDDVNQISARLWWLIGVLFVAGLGLMIWIIEEAVKGRFKV